MRFSVFNFIVFLMRTKSLFLHQFPFNMPQKGAVMNGLKRLLCASSMRKGVKPQIPKINGFYGLLGPDVDKIKVKSLYELFTANGQIQGVFLKDGEPEFKNIKINTEKLKFEKKFIRIPQNIFSIAIVYILNKLNLIPNLLGTANTALMKINQSLYALFERDLPYELDIDQKKKIIYTKTYTKIPYLATFSAHSKIIDNEIHTIDYDIIRRRINYFCLDLNFQIIKKATIQTTYFPVVHDFLVLRDSILFMDSPFYFDIRILFSSKIPVSFDETLPTKIHIYNFTTNKVRTLELEKGMYIFHYADFIETKNQIEFSGSLYQKMDFSNLEIYGKYRKIIIDKNSPKVFIESDLETDKYNLDFPIQLKNRGKTDKQILLNFENGGFNGFFILEKLKIKKKIFMDSKKICGEPAIFSLKNRNYLIGFSYDSNSNGFLFIIDLINYQKWEINLNQKLTLGFHSIFLNNQD